MLSPLPFKLLVTSVQHAYKLLYLDLIAYRSDVEFNQALPKTTQPTMKVTKRRISLKDGGDQCRAIRVLHIWLYQNRRNQ